MTEATNNDPGPKTSGCGTTGATLTCPSNRTLDENVVKHFVIEATDEKSNVRTPLDTVYGSFYSVKVWLICEALEFDDRWSGLMLGPF